MASLPFTLPTTYFHHFNEFQKFQKCCLFGFQHHLFYVSIGTKKKNHENGHVPLPLKATQTSQSSD